MNNTLLHLSVVAITVFTTQRVINHFYIRAQSTRNIRKITKTIQKQRNVENTRVGQKVHEL